MLHQDFREFRTLEDLEVELEQDWDLIFQMLDWYLAAIIRRLLQS